MIDESTAEPIVAGPFGTNPTTGDGRTFAQLQTKLAEMLGNRTTATPTRLQDWINDAYIAIAEEFEFDELQGKLEFATIAGQPLYTLPSGVGTLQDASIVGGATYAGRQLDKTDYNSYRHFEDASGEPERFFRYNRTLVLHPTPSTAQTIALGFTIIPAKLAGVEQLRVGRGMERAVLQRAKQFALEDFDEFDAAGAAGNSALGLVRAKIDPDAKEQTGRVMSISYARRRSDLRGR